MKSRSNKLAMSKDSNFDRFTYGQPESTKRQYLRPSSSYGGTGKKTLSTTAVSNPTYNATLLSKKFNPNRTSNVLNSTIQLDSKDMKVM